MLPLPGFETKKRGSCVLITVLLIFASAVILRVTLWLLTSRPHPLPRRSLPVPSSFLKIFYRYIISFNNGLWLQSSYSYNLYLEFNWMAKQQCMKS